MIKYSPLVESNNRKARAGIYIKNEIKYIRRSELEGLNKYHLILYPVYQNITRLITVVISLVVLSRRTPYNS